MQNSLPTYTFILISVGSYETLVGISRPTVPTYRYNYYKHGYKQKFLLGT